eukprot:GHUV01057147.1.p1 GENE.GHUV01057147.1~~GHUV01057147.1.p1  ORF type:complete len:171 (-),score=28.51 GHUV01057147.1:206-718(-)
MSKAADRKRERDETEVDTAMQELEASLNRDADMKLKALQTLRDLMDLKDEGYTVQRQAAEAGVLTMLMQLLEDDAESVRVDAAKALTAVTRHSTPTLSRLDVGKTIGFSQTPEKVSIIYSSCPRMLYWSPPRLWLPSAYNFPRFSELKSMTALDYACQLGAAAGMSSVLS